MTKALREGYKLIDIAGNGQCFYEAVAHQLSSTLRLSPIQLFKETLNYLKVIESQFKRFFGTYSI